MGFSDLVMIRGNMNMIDWCKANPQKAYMLAVVVLIALFAVSNIAYAKGFDGGNAPGGQQVGGKWGGGTKDGTGGGNGGGSGPSVQQVSSSIMVVDALPPDCTECETIAIDTRIRVFGLTYYGDLCDCPTGPVLVTGDGGCGG
jgi:hypothetical protein